MIKPDDMRVYAENELREVQTDNLYFGKNRGSIYWVAGAETWCYLCGDKTEWGQADELLANIDDSILIDYYKGDEKVIEEFMSNRNW